MFNSIKLILEILPLLIPLIKKLEDEFPQSGLGKMKLLLIVESINETVENSEQYLPLIKKITSKIVYIFNSFGVFSTNSTDKTL